MTWPGLIAVEDMLHPAERAGASISPDGTRIPFLPPGKNRFNGWVQDLDPGPFRATERLLAQHLGGRDDRA